MSDWWTFIGGALLPVGIGILGVSERAHLFTFRRPRGPDDLDLVFILTASVVLVSGGSTHPAGWEVGVRTFLMLQLVWLFTRLFLRMRRRRMDADAPSATGSYRSRAILAVLIISGAVYDAVGDGTGYVADKRMAEKISHASVRLGLSS